MSITTVSRYLNGRYEIMSENTKKRIQSVIETLNYQPNVLAQGLKGNRSRIVAVVVVNIGYPYCVALIRAIQDVLTTEGYSLAVCETGGDSNRELQVLQSLQAQQVDGLILQTSGHNNAEIRKIAAVTPVVLVDRSFSIPGVTSVVTNNESASKGITSFLFEEGYQNVVYVTEDVAGISTRAERLSGYQSACGFYARAPLVYLVNRDRLTSFSTVIRDLETMAQEQLTAVYTANGLIMRELYPALLNKGFQGPSPIGVATFDEPDWADLIRPRLTCVRQPTQETGQWAAHEILRMISEGHTSTSDLVHVLESTLVIGESTKLRTSERV